MEIKLRLNWHKSGTPVHRAFKEDAAFQYAKNYTDKIQPYAPIIIEGQQSKSEIGKTQGRVWFCDRSAKARILSSEELTNHLQKIWDEGVQQLHIVIGGANGFCAEDELNWRPNLRWSFGKMTLPHELAAVVALEQIYRAITIMHKHPYHLGH